MIENFSQHHVEGIIKLWNGSAVEDGYKELTAESFAAIFTGNPYFKAGNTFVDVECGEITGFACGCTGDDLPGGDAAGFITCIVLSRGYRDREHFKALLDKLEESFRAAGKRISDVIFFNPVMLPWYIPGTPRHEHNNAPGAPAGSFFHGALLQNGYAERTREVAMYLVLNDFAIPADILEKERQANEMGYEVVMFDRTRHFGVVEMLGTLGNPLWMREIPDCINRGIPVLIAAWKGQAAGFAGPLIRHPSGRGYFTGIGVAPAHEGKGLGSILFFRLCREFENIGADYMSLYTGIGNPALKIYEKAGFTKVREFSVMRKQL